MPYFPSSMFFKWYIFQINVFQMVYFPVQCFSNVIFFLLFYLSNFYFRHPVSHHHWHARQRHRSGPHDALHQGPPRHLQQPILRPEGALRAAPQHLAPAVSRCRVKTIKIIIIYSEKETLKYNLYNSDQYF